MQKRRIALAAAALATMAIGTPIGAQTDYYNTDAGRPVRVEDAYPVERYAWEAQVAPLRLERHGDGDYRWEFEPEVAYGILPGTHVELGLPVVHGEREGGRSGFGLAGIDLSLFHNLNVETRTLPALAVAAGAVLPVGGDAPDLVRPSVKGIATRTFPFARFHFNGEYTFGPAPEAGEIVGEASRWMAGVAVDRALPLRSALLIADAFVEEPLHAGEAPRWTVEAGARYQLDPYFALDAGVGRRLTGSEPGWFVTFGAARVFALRSLIPVPAR